MAEMISVREAAVRWNITERRVATLCKNGRIAGAKKQGNRWLIPADTQKPADQRLKTGAFRKTEIFNLWSVVNYFGNECEPRPFWVSTGSNDIIGEVLAQADEEIYNRLTSLVNGETFTTFIDTGVIYPQIKSNPSTIYSFLLVTGYLKAL